MEKRQPCKCQRESTELEGDIPIPGSSLIVLSATPCCLKGIPVQVCPSLHHMETEDETGQVASVPSKCPMAESLDTTAGVFETIKKVKRGTSSRVKQQAHRSASSKGIAQTGLRRCKSVSAVKAAAQELEVEAQNTIIGARKERR